MTGVDARTTVPFSIAQALLDDAPGAVVFISPDWSVAYANRRAAELADKSAREIAGADFWILFSRFEDAATKRRFSRVLKDGLEIEFDCEMSPGQWFQFRLRPIGNGLALYGTDVSENRIATQSLREREAELTDFLENGNVALHWVGPDGTILWANDAELALLGYTAEEYIGHSVKDYHVDPPIIDDILYRLANNEKLQSYEARLRRKDGSICHVAMNSSVYRKNGKFIHTRCFTRDITADKAYAQFQEHLVAIVNSSEDAIISQDLNGLLTSWNTSAERMFGFTAEEAVGQPVATLLVPEDRQHDEPEILSRLQKGEPVIPFETKRRKKDGTLLEIFLTVSPVKDSQGQIVGLSKTVRDITDRQRKERASQLLAAIVDNSEDAIISKNLDGVITSWNKSAERLFGFTGEEAIGQSVAALLIPDDRQDEEREILSRLRKGERTDHFETKRRRKDGALLDISLTVSPVKDSRNRIVGASKIARDITEQVRSRAALRKANNALRRSNADLEQFAYSASHDLQEPLRMVSTYTEMLRRKYGDKLDSRAHEYMDFVSEGGSRMERLLHDLRSFMQVSIAGEGRPPVVDSRTVLGDTLANLKPAIDEIRAEITSGPLPPVAIHEFQLGQLFQNLIVNAIRYRSDAPLRVHVEAVREGDQWKFSVRDNGIGIDPEYQEQIFGIFKRLHAAPEYPGTGMGLAICHRVLERAGGRIWVESEPGRGSTFFFRLPVEAPF